MKCLFSHLYRPTAKQTTISCWTGGYVLPVFKQTYFKRFLYQQHSVKAVSSADLDTSKLFNLIADQHKSKLKTVLFGCDEYDTVANLRTKLDQGEVYHVTDTVKSLGYVIKTPSKFLRSNVYAYANVTLIPL